MSLVHQAQILNGDAGLLRGSRSSVVRASTAKVGGLGFDSQWLPKFFPSVCFYSDLPPVAYQQFLLPVVVIRIVTKIIMYMYLICSRFQISSKRVFPMPASNHDTRDNSQC